jgi:uncharacterized protein (DUF1015 family)
MATIVPFRALRYNPARVSPQDVVTQPYDKISPAMQDAYYAASPYNLCRIILGKREASDDGKNNVYTRAAANLRNWRAEGVLKAEDAPSIYYYSQCFPLPGTTEPIFERRGFIAAGKLEEYDAGIVHRHEQTLSGPKVDRLNLLLATRAHFGQIFMLYSDPKFEIEAVLTPATAPDVDVTDEYGVQHRMWRVCDPAAVELVRSKMRDKKLIIADGHHRYETALNYRNEQRAKAGKVDPTAPYECVMMTFVNMDQEGLVILPTHRVVFGLAGFDVASFVEKAREFFTVNPLKGRMDGAAATALLGQKGENGTTLIAATAAGDFLLEAKPEAMNGLLASFSPLRRKLDVIQLHKVLLEHVLGISEEAIAKQTHINYLRGAEETLERARTDAAVNVAFLMNPCTMEQVRDISFAGEVMPQKSTDFFPKLLSGLTIYPLE